MLGRGVVVMVGDPVPPTWADAPVIDVEEVSGDVVGALHAAWLSRQPVVVRLGIDADRFRAPVSVVGDVWRQSPRLELWDDPRPGSEGHRDARVDQCDLVPGELLEQRAQERIVRASQYQRIGTCCQQRREISLQ